MKFMMLLRIQLEKTFLYNEDNLAYKKPSLTQITQEEPQVLFSGTDEVYDVVKDTTREDVPLQSISLQHNLAYETPSLTQITQEEPQVLFSGTDEAYGVVKDTTTEEVPLQSISLEHNVAYGKTKPSNEQQPLHIVYDTPLLLQQEEEEYSNIEYEDTEDEDEDDYI